MNLNDADHKLMALWAADCAEHVLFLFERDRPSDARPAQAVDAARAWTRGKMRPVEVGVYAAAAHEAALKAAEPCARAAAQAAEFAAATALYPEEAVQAAEYAVKAATDVVGPAGGHNAGVRELNWQRYRIPEHLRKEVFPQPLR